ncbi:MAG: hypothetical protein H7A37_01750 [Chlamydiales bacterium]|nr:hypothetical protein [Chlamydiia bacterium]MCP5507013.1 hypothetical protein [Chlamydiales bacterium]
MAEAVEKIAKVSKDLKKVEKVEEQMHQRIEPNKERFDHALRTDKPELAEQKQQPTKASLMDEIRDLNKKVDSVAKANPEELKIKVDDLIAKMEEAKNKLKTPGLELKSSVRQVLSNKLSHMDESLRITLDKAGLEYKPPEALLGPNNSPIERFLGYLTHGQETLGTLGDEVRAWGANEGSMNPAMMLAVQIKVGYMQQEIEFFTSLLNKALESTKTIMNVQV